jgi:hypothetical protein
MGGGGLSIRRRRAVARGGAPPELRRRRLKWCSRAPKFTGQGPKERGEHEELTEGLGLEEDMPEKEISGEGGAPARLP